MRNVPAYNDGTPVRIGDVITAGGRPCRVVRLRPMGTVDVEQVDGDRAWRVSGLRMVPACG